MPASTPQAPASPVPYSPSVELIADDEQETVKSAVESLLHISQVTWDDSGHALRSVHAKGHALLHGELTVLPGLPTVLAQGVFAKPGTLPAVLRLSTTPGDLLDDKVSTPRGLALKLIGVEGERLPGSEGAVTQDFILVNGPSFMQPDIKNFAKSLKLLAATTDKAEGAKKLLSALLRGGEKALEAVGGSSATAKAMGGHPLTHPLGETYFNQVPIRYGACIAKLQLAPVTPELKALTDAKVDHHDKPDALRDAINGFFEHHGGEWELRVQLCTNLETMPIEDASVTWPEEESPFITVARLSVPPQPAWRGDASQAAEDGLFFNVWHGLAAHQPLGSVNRARRVAYAASAEFRATHNNRPLAEPGSLGGCPFHMALGEPAAVNARRDSSS